RRRARRPQTHPPASARRRRVAAARCRATATARARPPPSRSVATRSYALDAPGRRSVTVPTMKELLIVGDVQGCNSELHDLVDVGIAPGKRPEQCTRGELTRIRNVDGKPWFESWRGPETVVFGHWAKLGKVDRPLVKGLDTGCVYGGRLTGIFWPSGKWVSVA